MMFGGGHPPPTSLLRQRSVLAELLCWRALPNGFLLHSVSHGRLFAQFWKTYCELAGTILSEKSVKKIPIREMCEIGALQLGSCKVRSDECKCGRGRKRE